MSATFQGWREMQHLQGDIIFGLSVLRAVASRHVEPPTFCHLSFGSKFKLGLQ